MFHVLLLEQDTSRKGPVSKEIPELDAGNKDSKEYKMKVFEDNAVYANESKSCHLPGLYYLVAWKGYCKEKNIWESLLAIQHLKKLISSFHKDHPEKPTATFLHINSTTPMARLTIKPARPISK